MTSDAPSPRGGRSGLPRPERPKGADDYRAAFDGILREEFLLDPLANFTIFTEGTSDIRYIELAADVMKRDRGIDLLKIEKSDEVIPVQVLTPRNPAKPETGGVPAMVRLARELGRWRGRVDFGFVAMLFDHDRAGKEGHREASGYLKHAGICLTLDPSQHETCLASAKDDVDIESLISIQFQRDFFHGLENATAWVKFTDGEIALFKWQHPSKGELLVHVEAEGTSDDLIEIARLVASVRDAWGFPTPL